MIRKRAYTGRVVDTIHGRRIHHLAAGRSCTGRVVDTRDSLGPFTLKYPETRSRNERPEKND